MADSFNSYDVGDAVRCTGTFTDANEIAYDPDNVYFQWRTPNGTLHTRQYGVDAAVQKSSTGVYIYDLNVDADGMWQYRWYALANDGDYQGAAKHKFEAVAF